MSLKQLRKQATSPKIQCPACGMEVPLREIGYHHAKCPAWTAAKNDALNPKHKKQSDIVMIKQSLSERWAPAILDSDWLRRHWIPSLCAFLFATWLVGYTQPQDSSNFWTIAIVPAIVGVALVGLTILDKRGMVKRWEKPQ
jgi:hypothetical protein